MTSAIKVGEEGREQKETNVSLLPQDDAPNFSSWLSPVRSPRPTRMSWSPALSPRTAYSPLTALWAPQWCRLHCPVLDGYVGLAMNFSRVGPPCWPLTSLQASLQALVHGHQLVLMEFTLFRVLQNRRREDPSCPPFPPYLGPPVSSKGLLTTPPTPTCLQGCIAKSTEHLLCARHCSGHWNWPTVTSPVNGKDKDWPQPSDAISDTDPRSSDPRPISD